ncbi:MAG: PKD-like domain-containing protein [Bacteroidia bacterium]
MPQKYISLKLAVALLWLIANLSCAIAQSPAPCPQLSLFTASVCDSGNVNLANQVREYAVVATQAYYYDANPAQGNVAPFAQTSVARGYVPANEVVNVSVTQPSTFWVVVVNDTATNACSDTAMLPILIKQKPSFTLGVGNPVCPGDTVYPVSVQKNQPGSLVFWQKFGANPGVGVSTLPTYIADANLTDAVRYDSIIVFTWLNGCLADQQIWKPAIKPAPGIQNIGALSVCSNEPIALSLQTSPSVPSAQFRWKQGGNIAANLIQDTITNQSSASQITTYTVVPVVDGCEGSEANIPVSVKPAPAVISVTVDSICSGMPFSYQPLNIGGISAASYTWGLVSGFSLMPGQEAQGTGLAFSDSLSTKSLTGDFTKYTVFPTGSNGCVGPVDTFPLFIKPLPSIARTETLFSCVDAKGASSFDLAAYSQFQLFEDETLLKTISTTNLTTASADTLYYRLADGTACGGRVRVILSPVQKPSQPVFSSSLTVCDNDVLEVSPGSGRFNFYDANNGNALAVDLTMLRLPAASCPDSILVTRNEAGCESTPSKARITVNPSPNIITSSNGPICETDNLQLTASGAFLYIWTGPQQFFSTYSNPSISGATVDIGGQYRVIGANGFSCRDTAYETVSVLPLPRPGRDTSITFCRLDPAASLFDVLGGNPTTGGVWAGPSALSGGGNGIIDPATSLSGTYTYSVVQTVACQITQSAVVHVKIANSLEADILGDTIAPLGGSLRLEGKGGQQYAWQGPNNFSSTLPNPLIQFNDPLDAGRFRLIVSTPGGCKDTAYHDIAARDTNTLFLDIRTGLQGAFDPSSNLMHDFLRQRNALSLFEPFSARGWALTSGAGSVLSSAFLIAPGAEAPVDWVLVELRLPSHPDSAIRIIPGVLRRDGKVVDVDGASLIRVDNSSTGDYLVVVRHRNHLAIRSQFSQRLSWRQPGLIRFDNPAFPVLGDPHARWIHQGKAYLFSGDANGDGEIQIVDDLFEWNLQVGQGGYLNADYNLDGHVQNSDRLYLWAPNVGRGTFVP